MVNKKSPNLNLVSSNPNEPQVAPGHLHWERRRVPRLNLTTEQFRLGLNGKIFSVADLSPGGMALRLLEPADFHLFPVGTRFEGLLNLKREKYPVRARVAHLGLDRVGCEFDPLDEAVQNALQKLFDPALLGAELHPIPAPEKGAIWFHGPSGTDLLFWRQPDGQISKMSLLILGTYVQWEAEEGVSTGRVVQARGPSDVRGVMRFETLVLEADSSPDIGKMDIAKKLLLSSNVGQDLQTWALKTLGRISNGS